MSSTADSPSAIATEEDRIRAAYARRPRSDVRYHPFNASHVFQAQDRERHVLRLLRRQGLTDLGATTILDVGCGSGSWLRQFIKWGAAPENVCGLDLRREAIATARRLCPAAVCLECGSAMTLPFGDESFDLVLQSTVLTSVLEAAAKQKIASELLRVLKRDGLILWYDFLFDNPRNPDVRGVGKREIHELFRGCRIDLRRVTLAPPLARWLAPRAWLVTYLLGRIPLLCAHYLGAIRKPTPPRAGPRD